MDITTQQQMAPQIERLRTLFGRPELNRLIERLNERRELGRPLTGTIILDAPSVEERRAIDQLLRRATSTGTTLSVSPEALLVQLRTSGLANSWEEVLEAVCGKPDSSRAMAAAHIQAWETFWSQLKNAVDPSLVTWIDQLRRDGVLKRLSEGSVDTANRWLNQALTVFRQMPFEGEPIASVAARLAGDSHALDPGSPLATIVLRGISFIHQSPMPINAAERRELWGKAGVICDELSAPVLVFNLVLPHASPLTEILMAAHAATMPIHITTRLLLSTNWNMVVSPPRVYVCENPSIVALAARQLGTHSAPIVCVDGEPKTAAWNLLRHLYSAGTEIWYHGDFDWKGLSIASRVITRLNARPWRFSVEDYLAANGTEELAGSPFEASWSPGLASAMLQRQKLVHEEAVADVLLADLNTGTRKNREEI